MSLAHHVYKIGDKSFSAIVHKAINYTDIDTTHRLHISGDVVKHCMSTRCSFNIQFAFFLHVCDRCTAITQVIGLTLVFTVTRGLCFAVQITYSCVTSGLLDHARPRRVMFKDLTLSTFPNPKGRDSSTATVANIT